MNIVIGLPRMNIFMWFPSERDKSQMLDHCWKPDSPETQLWFWTRSNLKYIYKQISFKDLANFIKVNKRNIFKNSWRSLDCKTESKTGEEQVKDVWNVWGTCGMDEGKVWVRCGIHEGQEMDVCGTGVKPEECGTDKRGKFGTGVGNICDRWGIWQGYVRSMCGTSAGKIREMFENGLGQVWEKSETNEGKVQEW